MSRITTVLLLFALLLMSSTVTAQQQDEASTLLPDIDPQDIEIIGDFDTAFPGISRQPVLGFSPRPAVYRVDPDRMPFMESDDEIVASIPISDLEPALKPEQRFIRFADQQTLFARAGVGMFTSQEVQVFAETPFRDRNSLAFDLEHFSSDGDREFSSFSDLSGGLQWTQRSGNNRWGAGIKGASSFNYSPVPGSVPEDLSWEDLQDYPEPHRLSYHSFGLEGRWQQLQHAYRGWQSSVSVNRFKQSGEHPDAETLTSRESQYKLLVNRFWDGIQREQVYGFKVTAAGSFYNTKVESPQQYWLTNAVNARYRQHFGHSHQVETWLGFYQLYDPVNDFDVYLYPDIHYRYDGGGRMSAGIRLRGFVKDPSLENLHSENRFVLQHDVDQEHERGLHIQLHSGAEFAGNTKVYSGLDYWQYYNKGYYSRQRTEDFPFYNYQFVEDAIQVEWYTGLTHLLSEYRTTATVEIGLNYSTADDDIIPSGEIPYVPRWKGSAQILSKPMSWLDVSVWMDFSGRRNTGVKEETVKGYTRLGARTDVRLHDRIGIYFKALNILDQDYQVWQNYQERPFQMYGGITAHW